MSDTDVLLDTGQWQQALAHAREHRTTLTEALEALYGLHGEASLKATARKLQLPVLVPMHFEHYTPRFDLMSWAEARQRNCLLAERDGQLTLVITNPLDDSHNQQIGRRLDTGFHTALAHPRDLERHLARLEESQRALHIDQPLTEAQNSPQRERFEISLASIGNDGSEVVRLVNAALFDALKFGASDIHLENSEHGLAIKYRLDGVLIPQSLVGSSTMAEQVISRLKVLAELDVAERRVPQDGRFTAAIGGRDIDFRVSIMPGLFGEDAVLRVLDRQSLVKEFRALQLEALGFDENARQAIRRLARMPYGMLLVTGPTGSGKTTTLYAALSEIHTGDDKIVTIEDPVEYQLPGILQIPVNEKKGLTFARGLRSILRHDPDKIMVGEIRDPETATIAIQAALTGHLVFTTVHANSVFDVIGRFRHMGVDNYSLVSALNGVVAQRLLRMICMHCREPWTPSVQELNDAGIDPNRAARWTRSRGCTQCHGTGYKGRRAVAEVLTLNDELKELLLRDASIGELKAAARTAGMKFMREVAVDCAAEGQTTLAEINRVTFAML